MITFFTLVLSAGCSGSDSTVPASNQSGARDQATAAACDKLAACDELRPGRTYDSREQCNIRQRSDWDSRWPPVDCDDRIDTKQLDICLSAIRAAECGDVVDLANIYLNKCAKANVCPR